MASSINKDRRLHKTRLVSDVLSRYGVRTVVLESQFFDGKPLLEPDFSCGRPIGSMVRMSTRISAEPGGAVGVTRWMYEYLEHETKEDQVKYELQTEMGEAPIETHPKILSFVEKYGWFDAQKKARFYYDINSKNFGTANQKENLAFLNRGSKAFNPGGSKKKMNHTNNPFFGVSAYLKLRARWSRTWAKKTIPSAMFGMVETPPNAPDMGQGMIQYEDSASWLRLGTKAVYKGTGWEITENWMLSGSGGWNKSIYCDACVIGNASGSNNNNPWKLS